MPQAPLAAEALLATVLTQLLVVILAARAGGWLLGRLGQPQVVGEIAAGLLLGPSLLGRLLPELHRAVFPDDADAVFVVLGQVGLVLLMFLVGLQIDFGHLRRLGRPAAGVALAGIVVPFAAGAGLGRLLHPHLAADIPAAGFTLFLATALSITAMPILGRILLEFDLARTPLGALVMAAAAVDDALGWIALAAVSAVVAGGFRTGSVLEMLALTLGFVLLMALVVRPILVRWLGRVLDPSGVGIGLLPLSVLLAAALASALATHHIGIFAVFGPFVLGAVLWDRRELGTSVVPRLQDFVQAFFLPVFFTYTGLRTDVRLLDTPSLWLACALVVLVAVAGKTLGCGLAARVGGLDWRASACVAVLMNTRALMGLVAIHVGRDLGVIPDTVFCMLVIMALVTTFMTSPLLRRLLPADAAALAAGTATRPAGPLAGSAGP